MVNLDWKSLASRARIEMVASIGNDETFWLDAKSYPDAPDERQTILGAAVAETRRLFEAVAVRAASLPDEVVEREVVGMIRLKATEMLLALAKACR